MIGSKKTCPGQRSASWFGCLERLCNFLGGTHAGIAWMAWPSFPVVQADATAYDLVLLGNSQVTAMGCNSLQNGMNVPSTQHVKWKTCVSKKHGMECNSKFGRNPIFWDLVLASGLRSLIGAKTICPPKCSLPALQLYLGVSVDIFHHRCRNNIPT